MFLGVKVGSHFLVARLNIVVAMLNMSFHFLIKYIQCAAFIIKYIQNYIFHYISIFSIMNMYIYYTYYNI